jgi:predicted RecB family nuclease
LAVNIVAIFIKAEEALRRWWMVPSYSLKVVEEYVGFKRTQDEYGGSWAMAKFILATETEDEAQRDSLMAEILKYNEEDLEATWAVFDWLRKK